MQHGKYSGQQKRALAAQSVPEGQGATQICLLGVQRRPFCWTKTLRFLISSGNTTVARRRAKDVGALRCCCVSMVFGGLVHLRVSLAVSAGYDCNAGLRNWERLALAKLLRGTEALSKDIRTLAQYPVLCDHQWRFGSSGGGHTTRRPTAARKRPRTAHDLRTKHGLYANCKFFFLLKTIKHMFFNSFHVILFEKLCLLASFFHWRPELLLLPQNLREPLLGKEAPGVRSF